MLRLFRFLFGSIAARWVTGIAVTLLLSGGAYKWYAYKGHLRQEGQQVCVQEINKQTVIDLANALAAEKSVAAELRATAAAAAVTNQEARARLRESESRVASLLTEIQKQRQSDETYKAWSDTTLPAGVAKRVRDAAAGRDPDTSNEDSN